MFKTRQNYIQVVSWEEEISISPQNTEKREREREKINFPEKNSNQLINDYILE